MSVTNKSKPAYFVRQMLASDYNAIRDIWRTVGFEIYKYGNEVMVQQTDPNGLFVAQDSVTGEIIGVCSGINLSPQLAFVGQYAVRPEYQGLGVGKALWDKTIEHMGDTNVGLFTGNLKVLQIYRNTYGFKVIPDRRLLRMRGQLAPKGLTTNIEGITLVAINNDRNISRVIEYDKQVCNDLDRGVMLRALCNHPDSLSLMAIDKLGQVVGYCVIADSALDNAIISPLYADNQAIAELLVGQCCQQIPSNKTKNILYSCWDTNQGSIEIAHKLGLSEVRSLYILFTKHLIDGHLDKIYSITAPCFYPF